MYRLSMMLTLILFSLTVGAITFNYFRITPKDRALYAEIEAKAKSSQSQSQEGPSTFAQQLRQKVVKEFWLNQHLKRQLIRIQSTGSELFFFPEQKGMEIVEQMDGVDCVIQEEFYYLLPNGQEVLAHNNGQRLYLRGKNPEDPSAWIDPKKTPLTPMQKIRTLIASKACYNYTTHLFIADNVKMWTYEIKSHEIPSSLKNFKPLIESTAESVEFSLHGEEMNIKAHRLKAQFNTQSQKL